MVGGRFRREGAQIGLRLIHVVVGQKPTQHCKTIILQLKNKLKNIRFLTLIPFKNLCQCDHIHLCQLGNYETILIVSPVTKILIEVHVFDSYLGRWLMSASVKEGTAETMSQFSMSCLISQFWKKSGKTRGNESLGHQNTKRRTIRY